MSAASLAKFAQQEGAAPADYPRLALLSGASTRACPAHRQGRASGRSIRQAAKLPIACSPFFTALATRGRARTREGAVDERFFEVGVRRKRRKYRTPNVGLGPSGAALVHTVPRSGMGSSSRHGRPVCAAHSAASTAKRLSAAVRLASVALPGTHGAIRPYWSALRIHLGIPSLRKSQDIYRLLQSKRPARVVPDTGDCGGTLRRENGVWRGGRQGCPRT